MKRRRRCSLGETGRVRTRTAVPGRFRQRRRRGPAVSAGTGNLSQLLVNEYGRLVDRTVERGLTTVNLGGRLPVWFDYDGDKLTDFVMTQYGGIAKLYRQSSPGRFTETTSDARLLCKRFHYGQLVDVTGDEAWTCSARMRSCFPRRL